MSQGLYDSQKWTFLTHAIWQNFFVDNVFQRQVLEGLPSGEDVVGQAADVVAAQEHGPQLAATIGNGLDGGEVPNKKDEQRQVWQKIGKGFCYNYSPDSGLFLYVQKPSKISTSVVKKGNLLMEYCLIF